MLSYTKLNAYGVHLIHQSFAISLLIVPKIKKETKGGLEQPREQWRIQFIYNEPFSVMLYVQSFRQRCPFKTDGWSH